MTEFLATYRSFSKPSRMLMINQFAINTGFFMLMPYLAGYMAGPLGLAAWAVGLVLGIRNFSQQGMFLVGGTLADRLGYKPLIVAGCLLRTGGFALLAFADSLPALIIASAATGFAGALFNPAVRAYLAVDSADRRVEAFAMFNIFYQAGILFGPVVGLALMAFDFRATAAGSAIVFALLTVAQLRALPQHEAEQKTASVLDDWRVVLANRPFLLFSAAMIGCYVLSFQVYLALPMQATRVVGAEAAATLMTAVFVVSGLIAIAGQLRITRWFAARWGGRRAWFSAWASWRPRSCRCCWYPAPGSAPRSRSGPCCRRRRCSVSVRRRCSRSRWIPWSRCAVIGWWPPITGCTTPSSASASCSAIWARAPSWTRRARRESVRWRGPA